MCNKEYFYEFVELKTLINVHMGDNFSCKAESLVNIKVHFNVCSKFTSCLIIKNVYLIEELETNLPSIDTIDNSGYRVVLADGKAQMYNRN